MIALEVCGVPAPKGSGRAMLIAGKARYIASSSSNNAKRQRHWSDAVREVALGQPDAFAGVPLAVTIAFRMPRPKAHLTKAGAVKAGAPRVPLVYPDVDKLTRCTLDAITTRKTKARTVHGIIDDDSRIVQLEVSKVYAEPGGEGASITIQEWRP